MQAILIVACIVYLMFFELNKAIILVLILISQLSDFVSIKKAVVFAKKRSSRALTRFEEPRSAISVQYHLTQQSLSLNRLVLRLRCWVEAQHDHITSL